jgi:hypothetical protein
MKGRNNYTTKFATVDEYIAAQPAAVQQRGNSVVQDQQGHDSIPVSEPVPVKLIERLVRFRARGIK